MMRSCLDHIGLWSCLLRIVLIACDDTRRYSLLWVSPFLELVALGYKREEQATWTLANKQHTCIHFSFLLTMDVILLVVSSSCFFGFPAMMGYILESWAKINPLSSKLLCVCAFYQSNKNWSHKPYLSFSSWFKLCIKYQLRLVKYLHARMESRCSPPVEHRLPRLFPVLHQLVSTLLAQERHSTDVQFIQRWKECRSRFYSSI